MDISENSDSRPGSPSVNDSLGLSHRAIQNLDQDQDPEGLRNVVSGTPHEPYDSSANQDLPDQTMPTIPFRYHTENDPFAKESPHPSLEKPINVEPNHMLGTKSQENHSLAGLGLYPASLFLSSQSPRVEFEATENRAPAADNDEIIFIKSEPRCGSPFVPRREPKVAAEGGNDLIFIYEQEATSGTRRKWSQEPSSHPVNSPVLVKTEPHQPSQQVPAVAQFINPPKKVINTLKGQAALLNMQKARRQQKPSALPTRNTMQGTAAIGSLHLPRVLSTPTGNPRGFRGRVSEQPIIIEEIDDQAEFANALHRDQSDDWMENIHAKVGGESEDDDFEANKVLISRLERRKLKGKLSGINEIALRKARENILLASRRKAIADQSKAETGDLNYNDREDTNDRNFHPESSKNLMFVSEDEDDDEADEGGPSSRKRSREYRYSGGEFGDDDLSHMLVQDHQNHEEIMQSRDKGKGSKKSRQPVAKTAKEIEERRREDARNKKQRAKGKSSKTSNKSQNSGKDKGRKSKGKGKEREKNKGRKTYASRMRNRNDNAGVVDPVLVGILESLAHNNMVEDREALGDFGAAPVITETTKAGQLTKLIAAVPENYDVHRTKSDKSSLLKASKRFGYAMVKAERGKWRMKGMETPLYHHQLLAADWMVGRELAETAPHGGLLADAMGLGKTIEMLATMVGNRPDARDISRGCRTTLLVVPASAILQWKNEITRHTEPHIFPTVLQYRRSMELPIALLKGCDIVLTTYTEVMNSYPRPPKGPHTGPSYEQWMKDAKESAGDLHRIEWFRIVLDEAHTIKNNGSQTSIACQSLSGKRRWAMSGTPIQNRLDELFPYFRFLRVEWSNDYLDFKKHFCDPDADDANARVAVVLSIIMMRRTMRDKILGLPIVPLPQIHAQTKYISFSKEESVLYRLLEDRFRQNLNHHFSQGTAAKNYGTFMVQLLRLRQCTAHPFLLEQTIKDTFNLQDIKKLKAKLATAGRVRKPIYEQIEMWVKESEEAKQARRDAGEDVPEGGDAASFGRSSFGERFKMNKFLDSINEADMQERCVCLLCGDVPQDPQETDCHCIFCKLCLENWLGREEALESDYMECPQCHRVFSEIVPYKQMRLHDDDNDDGSPTQSNNGDFSTRGRGTKNDNLKTTPQIRNSEWLKLVLNKKAEFLPSAKLIALKAQILKWLDEAPEDKILIFTQFRLMARLIGLLAEKEGWNFVYFTGDMNRTLRHSAVQRFHDDKNVRIMIASLKCGGQALNLTCANRVVSIDLWWNHSVEQQAFGRVFRIGQHKETYVARFVVKNSVDARMLGMQADKIKLIDRALQDTGKVVDPLNIYDLASLFGHLKEDADGEIRVERDYRDDDDDVEDEDGEEGNNGSGSREGRTNETEADMEGHADEGC